MTLALLLLAATLIPGPVCDTVWHDGSRDRAVPVRVRMPAGTGKAPVILFSHGLGGTRDAGTRWATAWAEAGFVVVHLQHPGSDAGVLRGGRASIVRAMSGEQLAARARDVRFALDTVARGERTGACDLSRADMTRAGMSGHSFGAHTTLAVAGQNFLGRRGPLGDPRIRAAVAFSPAPPQGQPDDAAAFGGIAIPFFSLTGSADVVPGLTSTTAQDRTRPFRAMPAGGKYLLWLDGATHADFGGNPRFRAPEPRIERIVARATTLFWRATLMGDAAARAALERETPIQIGPADRFERR